MSLAARRSLTLLSCAVLVSLTVASTVGQGQGQGRGLGREVPGSPGRKARNDIAPPTPGALNGAAAVDALSSDLGLRVRDRGGVPDEYAALLASDDSLWISEEGQLMFVDVLEHEAGPEDPDPDEPASPTGPAPAPLFLLPNGMPIHHSKPGAPWTIYLDFDGQFVTNTAWGFNAATPGLSIDANASAFNPDEQAIISRTWGRVAEDWAPFNVDVTTELPVPIGPTVLWSIIARSPVAFGFSSGVAGVALFDLGGMPFGARTPAFTFTQPIGVTNHSMLADVITQEAGHMFGLAHDGLDTGLEYYAGHGTGTTSWGPVMGGPDNRNVTQWSRNEYPDGGTRLNGESFGIQDDIAIIASRLGFRADDYGNTIATAVPLAQPHAGFITSSADVDVFALPIANEVHIEITPFRAGESTDGGNLDVAADILNAAGAVVATVDDVHETIAALTADLPSSQHYLRVRPSFDPANYTAYGSLGAYTVTGTFVRTVNINGFQEPLISSLLTPGRTVPVKFTLTDAVAAARVLLLTGPLAPPDDALAESLCKAQTLGRQHCNLKLPASLQHGSTYWIVAQFQDIDGSWVTARPVTGGSAENPLPILVE